MNSYATQVMAQQRALAPAGLRLVQHLPASKLLAFSAHNDSLRHIKVLYVLGVRTRDVRVKAEEPKQAEQAKAPAPVENDPVRSALTTRAGASPCMPHLSPVPCLLVSVCPPGFNGKGSIW